MSDSARTTRPGRPVIGVTMDIETDRPVDSEAKRKTFLRRALVDAIVAAGGAPVLLPPPVGAGGMDEDDLRDVAAAMITRCDGVVMSGGDDPIMDDPALASRGAQTAPMHPKATAVHPDRQAFELALLDVLNDERRDTPVLGVCLGMQYMGLHAGGALDQFLPETLETHDEHWDAGAHQICGTLAGDNVDGATVYSHHRQALTHAGRLEFTAWAPDGVVEAIADPQRAFYVGVQWHPERTDDPRVGADVFTRFIESARTLSGAAATPVAQ